MSKDLGKTIYEYCQSYQKYESFVKSNPSKKEFSG